MKKIMLSALLLGTITSGVKAQANSILAFGTASYSRATSDNNNYYDNNQYTLGFNPGIGYQFDEHWTLGITGSYNTNRSKIYTSFPGNLSRWQYQDDYGAGLFARNTISLGKIFSIYNQLEIGYYGNRYGMVGTPDSVFNIQPQSANGFKASLTPAIAVNVWKGFALNFNIGGINYNYIKSEATPSQLSNSRSYLGVTFGNQYNIGISKNFLCHKGKHHSKMNDGENEKETDNNKED